mgnify:CR=1 FL=1
MDIVTIGEVLIDLTQTGRDERGIPQFAANPGGAPPIWQLQLPGWAHRLPLSARWVRMPLAAI